MAVSQDLWAPLVHAPEQAALVPRFEKQGYDEQSVAARRKWIEQKTRGNLAHVGSYSISTEAMRGNIENPVGTVQVPLGIAGPLLIHGTHAHGVFYVPMATTEGALVRSYERGMTTFDCRRALTVSVKRRRPPRDTETFYGWSGSLWDVR